MSKRFGFKTEGHGWKLVTEPPTTIGMDLSPFRETPLVFNYPAHSQTVEHAVKTTSEAVHTTISYEAQLGNAFATIDSRRKLKGRVTRKRLLEAGSPHTPRRKKFQFYTLYYFIAVIKLICYCYS